MGQLNIVHSLAGIEGLCSIEPAVHADSRGYFMETYSMRDMAQNGLLYTFVQDNQSRSVRGTLRGLHFQREHPQAKLLRVTRGAIFDVAVDLRSESPSYGRWHGIVLSEENHLQLLIPKGFAHGFLVLSDIAELQYKCDDFYHPEDEGGIAWNAPCLDISWPGILGTYSGSASASGYVLEDGTALLLSEKDQAWPAALPTL